MVHLKITFCNLPSQMNPVQLVDRKRGRDKNNIPLSFKAFLQSNAPFHFDSRAMTTTTNNILPCSTVLWRSMDPPPQARSVIGQGHARFHVGQSEIAIHDVFLYAGNIRVPK